MPWTFKYDGTNSWWDIDADSATERHKESFRLERRNHLLYWVDSGKLNHVLLEPDVSTVRVEADRKVGVKFWLEQSGVGAYIPGSCAGSSSRGPYQVRCEVTIRSDSMGLDFTGLPHGAVREDTELSLYLGALNSVDLHFKSGQWIGHVPLKGAPQVLTRSYLEDLLPNAGVDIDGPVGRVPLQCGWVWLPPDFYPWLADAENRILPLEQWDGEDRNLELYLEICGPILEGTHAGITVAGTELCEVELSPNHKTPRGTVFKLSDESGPFLLSRCPREHNHLAVELRNDTYTVASREVPINLAGSDARRYFPRRNTGTIPVIDIQEPTNGSADSWLYRPKAVVIPGPTDRGTCLLQRIEWQEDAAGVTELRIRQVSSPASLARCRLPMEFTPATHPEVTVLFPDPGAGHGVFAVAQGADFSGTEWVPISSAGCGEAPFTVSWQGLVDKARIFSCREGSGESDRRLLLMRNGFPLDRCFLPAAPYCGLAMCLTETAAWRRLDEPRHGLFTARSSDGTAQRWVVDGWFFFVGLAGNPPAFKLPGDLFCSGQGTKVTLSDQAYPKSFLTLPGPAMICLAGDGAKPFELEGPILLLPNSPGDVPRLHGFLSDGAGKFHVLGGALRPGSQGTTYTVDIGGVQIPNLPARFQPAAEAAVGSTERKGNMGSIDWMRETSLAGVVVKLWETGTEDRGVYVLQQPPPGHTGD